MRHHAYFTQSEDGVSDTPIAASPDKHQAMADAMAQLVTRAVTGEGATDTALQHRIIDDGADCHYCGGRGLDDGTSRHDPNNRLCRFCHGSGKADHQTATDATVLLELGQQAADTLAEIRSASAAARALSDAAIREHREGKQQLRAFTPQDPLSGRLDVTDRPMATILSLRDLGLIDVNRISGRWYAEEVRA